MSACPLQWTACSLDGVSFAAGLLYPAPGDPAGGCQCVPHLHQAPSHMHWWYLGQAFPGAGTPQVPGTKRVWKNYRGGKTICSWHTAQTVNTVPQRALPAQLVINPESSRPRGIRRTNDSVGFKRESSSMCKLSIPPQRSWGAHTGCWWVLWGREEMQRPGLAMLMLIIAVVNF